MARVTQEEMDQRIAAYGGSGLTHSPNVSKRKIPNPEHGKHGGTKWVGVPDELDIEVQRWKGAGTNGAEIEAYRLPDGSWEIVKEQPAQQTTTSATTKPAIPPGGRSETEGTPIRDANGTITGWDNNRPRAVIYDRNNTPIWSEELTGADLTAWRNNQQANQPQTNTGEIPVNGRPGWTEIKTEVKTPQGTTTKSQFRGPNGQIVDTLPPSESDRLGKPTGNTDTITKNGRTVKRTEYLLPDGTREWREQAETTEPDRVGKPTGNTRTRVENGQAIKETEYALPDGKTEWRSQTAPAEASAYGANIPAWTPTDGDDYGLGERTRQLIALADAGKIPRESVAKQLEADRAQAEMAATARTRRETNARLERQQAETERAGRSSMVGSAWQRAQEEPKGQEAYAGWNAPYRFAGEMALQRLYGGMGAWGQAAASTAPPVAAVGPPAPNPAAVGEVAPLTQDERAGVAAEQARRAAAMANPVFRPQAPVGSPLIFGPQETPPAVQGTPSPLGDTGAPPVSLAPAYGDAMYGAGSTFDDTERNLIAEGFDPDVVRRVRQRREARLTGAMA